MSHALGHYRIWVLLFLLLLITAEIIWSWRTGRKVYSLKESAANFFILVGFQLSKYVFAGYQLFVIGLITPYALFKLPENTLVFAGTFIFVDFVYYWYHRLSHSWKPLWAFHVVHHSSQLMNLTTSYRLNWLSALVSPLLFSIPVLVGCPVNFVVTGYAINLLYQFFMHTEAVGKLGVLEGVIDTPSAHRVHHGSNPRYIDKNFGGVLMIWDRLFKTYEPETEPVRYGITQGFISSNPFILVFHGFVDLFRKNMKYKG